MNYVKCNITKETNILNLIVISKVYIILIKNYKLNIMLSNNIII